MRENRLRTGLISTGQIAVAGDGPLASAAETALLLSVWLKGEAACDQRIVSPASWAVRRTEQQPTGVDSGQRIGKRLADLTGGVVARRLPDLTWWVARGVVAWQRRS